jgi:DUF1009 family protein
MNPIVGLVAGNGKLPLTLAANIRAAGYRLVTIGHIGETRKDLQRYSDLMEWVHIGELGRIIEILRAERVEKVVFIGGVSKKHFFSKAKPDARAIQLVLRLTDKKDDAILRAIAQEIESEGMEVISPLIFLEDHMAPQGVLTERSPTEREEKDIQFGWAMAKRLGELDVGQTVVVKDQIVLALEAIEGTDAAIRRGGKLGKGGVVVVKVVKPSQDLRLDLPVIGPTTIHTLNKAQASALAIESGKTIVVEKDRTIQEANQNRLCIVGI